MHPKHSLSGSTVLTPKGEQWEVGPIPAALRRLLMEISLMGLGCGLRVEAFQLLQLLRAVEPDAAYPLLGLSQFYMLNNEMEKARELLSELALRQDLLGTPLLKMVQALQTSGAQILRTCPVETV
ncbi:hypothetical protein AMD24_00229 [Candidatus Xiphinematobacter sp. Idaho Grape]|jgi:hypothetical protein|uniref:tetratricopeptide repeat protein n=1 Tax=Candidatus Xiphinematobacter sp. Idaho Grape TaxID=1704307 RepID=UPI000705D806|nr:tetratricopeptide repeat protein [Candidatus Xiphinematobacter sp. Idaho Grape]ALJ56417.1 hypothetical protein AMD24_00229 [Candidatus Xiphinematobacter sp. Idaho Grape]